jgi:hypothetical protein
MLLNRLLSTLLGDLYVPFYLIFIETLGSRCYHPPLYRRMCCGLVMLGNLPKVPISEGC